MAERPTRLENMAAAWALSAADTVRDHTEAAARLPAAAPAALTSLFFHPGISVGRRANAVRLTHSGAVRLLDRLEHEGLVERTAARDGRVVAARLTARGREAAARVLSDRARAVSRLLEPLDENERRTLSALLEKLLAALPSDRKELETICRLCDYLTCEGTRRECPVDRSLLARGL